MMPLCLMSLFSGIVVWFMCDVLSVGAQISYVTDSWLDLHEVVELAKRVQHTPELPWTT